MKILDKKIVPGLAALYLAQVRNNPDCLIELVDTQDPEIKKKTKWVMMFSTQFGCAVGCAMCDVGSLGYLGNLTKDEIISQVRFIIEANPDLDIQTHPKVKMHFERMGEPALNHDVIAALEDIGEKYPYKGVIPCISTVAPKTPLVDKFLEELIAVKDRYFKRGRFQLQFSIHASDEECRSGIIPIKRYSLEEVAAYGKRFVKKGDRKITLNFSISKHRDIDIEALTKIFPADKFLFKITPINPTQASDAISLTYVWKTVPARLKTISRALKKKGFEVVESPSLKKEIEAETSCGQLWSGVLKERARIFQLNLSREAQCYVACANIDSKSLKWISHVCPDRVGYGNAELTDSALIVLNMHEKQLNPRSTQYFPPARAISGNIARIIHAYRKMKKPIFYLIDSRKSATQIANVFDHTRYDESVFEKIGPSAFINPRLERILSDTKTRTLLLVGTSTNTDIKLTAKDALRRRFKVAVAVDATAANDEQTHIAGLKEITYSDSSLLTAKEIIEIVSGSKPGTQNKEESYAAS
ncbi:isochorismatase family protein [Elusimicrobiota bacterium]